MWLTDLLEGYWSLISVLRTDWMNSSSRLRSGTGRAESTLTTPLMTYQPVGTVQSLSFDFPFDFLCSPGRTPGYYCTSFMDSGSKCP